MKNKILLMLGMMMVLLLAGTSSAITYINNCLTDLNIDGELYYLNATLTANSSTVSCLNITANNIVLTSQNQSLTITNGGGTTAFLGIKGNNLRNITISNFTTVTLDVRISNSTDVTITRMINRYQDGSSASQYLYNVSNIFYNGSSFNRNSGVGSIASQNVRWWGNNFTYSFNSINDQNNVLELNDPTGLKVSTNILFFNNSIGGAGTYNWGYLVPPTNLTILNNTVSGKLTMLMNGTNVRIINLDMTAVNTMCYVNTPLTIYGNVYVEGLSILDTSNFGTHNYCLVVNGNNNIVNASSISSTFPSGYGISANGNNNSFYGLNIQTSVNSLSITGSNNLVDRFNSGSFTTNQIIFTSGASGNRITNSRMTNTGNFIALQGNTINTTVVNVSRATAGDVLTCTVGNNTLVNQGWFYNAYFTDTLGRNVTGAYVLGSANNVSGSNITLFYTPSGTNGRIVEQTVPTSRRDNCAYNNNTNFTFVKSVPANGYYNENLTTNYTTLTGNVQENIIIPTALDIALNCLGGTQPIYLFSFIDERNLGIITANLTYNVHYNSNNQTGLVAYGNFTNTTYFYICIDSNVSTYEITETEITYKANGGYVQRKYYLFKGEKSTQNLYQLNLFDLDTAHASAYTFIAKDTNNNPYVGYYASLYRWYPDLNDWRVVEMGITDTNGKATMWVENVNALYRMVISTPYGVTVKTWDGLQFNCGTTPSTCESLLSIPTPLPITPTLTTTSLIQDIYYSAPNFVYTWTDPSSTTQRINLTVYRQTGTSQTGVCSTSSTAQSGTLLCNISSSGAGTFVGIVYRTAINVTVPVAQYTLDVRANIRDITQAGTSGSALGLFFLFVIAVMLFTVGVWSPVASIGLGILALIPAYAIGSVTFTVVLGVAVMGGVVIHFMKKT